MLEAADTPLSVPSEYLATTVNAVGVLPQMPFTPCTKIGEATPEPVTKLTLVPVTSYPVIVLPSVSVGGPKDTSAVYGNTFATTLVGAVEVARVAPELEPPELELLLELPPLELLELLELLLELPPLLELLLELLLPPELLELELAGAQLCV